MARTRRITLPGALLGSLALAASCAFPAPNEEVPLGGAVDAAPRATSSPDVSEYSEPVATVIAARAPDTEAVAEPTGVDENIVVFGPRAPVATTVIEVQGTPVEPLAHVDVAGTALQALERDGAVELPPAVETALVPAAVVVGDDVDSGADGATNHDASVGGARDTGSVGTIVAAATVGEPIVFVERSLETTDGLRMHYRVGGTGPNVVLIHGWCGNGAQWDVHASVLAASSRVFSVDLPGHGSSRSQPGSATREAWTIPQFASDIARLVEVEDLKDVVLVGHAMGGQVALESAVRLPGRIRAIIGVDSLQRLGVEPNPERVEPYVARFEDDFAGSMRAFIDEAASPNTVADVRARILADALATSPQVAVSLMRHFGTHDPRAAASTIDCRVICINSEMAVTDVVGNRALLTTFDVDLMPGSGHWPHLEVPGAFQTRLIRSLNRVQPLRPDENSARLQSLSPIVYCEDVAAARAFYVEGLLFTEIDRRPSDEALAPDFVSLERDGASIMIQSIATLRSDLPDVYLEPRDAVLFLRVTDLEAERRRLGDGADIAVPERTLSSGSRQLVVRDPAGTFVVLQQAPRVTAR